MGQVSDIHSTAEQLALVVVGGSVDVPPKRDKLPAETKAKITRRIPQVG
jgi:hypothetical protein